MEVDNSQLDWLPLARQLVKGVADLFELLTLGGQEPTPEEYIKLLQAAHRLEQFSGSAQSRSTHLSQHKLWHDLRNLVGNIMGYSELIQEQPDLSQQALDQIDKVLLICQQVLRHEAEHITEEMPAISLPNHTSTETGTILIVDDQVDSRELLKHHLLQDQHTVLEAADGLQMFDVLAEHEVDLILLDLILPAQHGDALILQLKSDEALRAIPVIVVSGNKDTERVIRCIEQGAEDYLFKPFNSVLLRARINAGIERKRWYDKEQQYRQELERNQLFIRSVFGRYLSKEIVETLLENPDGLDLGGAQREVTVLMVDISGFTSIAERLPPQRVVKLLNNYLGAMADIVMEHNGTVDEFIGDAVLAIFGAPISRSDDGERAIKCALAMQEAIPLINELNRDEGLPEIEVGISINTGQVIAGNIGSKNRAKYGVVGHTVNQTARIEDHCLPGTILISEATLNCTHAFISVNNSRTIRAKGILKAIRVYEIVDLAPSAYQSSAYQANINQTGSLPGATTPSTPSINQGE